MLDKDKIKQSLTIEDINLILSDLGSSHPIGDGKGNYIYQTVCHGGHKQKLYYYSDTKFFHCYTDCQCSFDIYELIIKAKSKQGMKFNFNDALYYVAKATNKLTDFNKVVEAYNPDVIDDWEFINKYKTIKKPDVNLMIHSEKILDLFYTKPYESWIDEGISELTMKKFNISYYIKEDKIVIPHYDINSNLIGIRGRNLREELLEQGKKYMPLVIENKMYSHPLMYNLYGLHITKEAIRRYKRAIIFEAEKSVLKGDTFYGKANCAVACCGSTISDYQRDLLLGLEIEEVIIALDKEFTDPNSDEARIYAEKLVKLAYKFTPYVRTFIIWDGLGLIELKDSPIDKGQEIFETLFKNKYEITTKIEGVKR